MAKTPAGSSPVPIPYPNVADKDKSPQAARQTPKTDFGDRMKRGVDKALDAKKARGPAQKKIMLTPLDVANTNPVVGNGAPGVAPAPLPAPAPIGLREGVRAQESIDARPIVKAPVIAAPAPVGLPALAPAPVMVAPPVKLEQPLQVQPVLVQPVQLQTVAPARR